MLKLLLVEDNLRLQDALKVGLTETGAIQVVDCSTTCALNSALNLRLVLILTSSFSLLVNLRGVTTEPVLSMSIWLHLYFPFQLA
jgi:hypothetical protein